LRLKAMRCDTGAKPAGQQSRHHHQSRQCDHPLRGDGTGLTQ
jgi:hypothetical protein